eukprot:14064889-Ditylum_brightwellii.AAC.1
MQRQTNLSIVAHQSSTTGKRSTGICYRWVLILLVLFLGDNCHDNASTDVIVMMPMRYRKSGVRIVSSVVKLV